SDEPAKMVISAVAAPGDEHAARTTKAVAPAATMIRTGYDPRTRRAISTTTFVALTTQTTAEPGLRSSSFAASPVMRLTGRRRPGCPSTAAATRSFATRVTIPGNRFR